MQYCNMVEGELELQSHSNVHFWSETLAKGMNHFFLQLWVKYHHYCPFQAWV